MYQTIKDYRFYNVSTDNHKHSELDIIEKLENKLPHGSGINSNWFIHLYRYSGNIFLNATNYYHAMDEHGGYCHIYKFTANYMYHPVTQVKCKYCAGKGYRLLSDIHKYHPDKSINQMIEFLHKGGIEVLDNHTILLFTCNVCHGNKFQNIPEFQLTDRRILFGKELNCCGYGLEDYLSQALYIWAE